MIKPRLNVVLWLVNYDELVFGHLLRPGPVNHWFLFGLLVRSLCTLNSALGLLPCPVCWVLKLLETSDLPGVSFLPCAWVLKLLACCCLESTSLDCSSPLVLQNFLSAFSAQRKRVIYLDPQVAILQWEITGWSNDLFTYWFCKDKSTRLRPAKDLQSAMFKSVLSGAVYIFYKP